MHRSTVGTISRKREFGQLEIDDAFLYHDQLYRKESKLSAVLIRWAGDPEKITELVSHRFYPEIIVELPIDPAEQRGTPLSNE